MEEREPEKGRWVWNPKLGYYEQVDRYGKPLGQGGGGDYFFDESGLTAEQRYKSVIDRYRNKPKRK